MRGWILMTTGLTVAVLAAGCNTPTRLATRITDVPRVDLDLTGGNRGYLIGKAPEGAQLKTTRQVIETDVELPSFYKPKRSTAAAAIPETPSSGAAEGMAVQVPSADTGPMDTYVVKPGESLWTIAGKPEIYGKTTRWQRLLEANRELLKGNPNHLRAGMTIKIPRGKHARGSSSEDEGTKFQK